jgi:3-deoxy-D-manno-octulosonic-acid transferase
MPYLLNGLYFLLVLILSPWLIYKSLTNGKYRRGLWRKFLGDTSAEIASARQPTAWFHGVSVGEIHLLRPVVASFRERHANWRCVISTTTDTGHEEARNRFPGLPVIYWPLDFTWAVNRTLHAVNPDLVVLAEGELWPNFLLAAKRLDVPVTVINGRLSPKSYRRYEWVRRLARIMLRKIDLIVAQTEAYAECYHRLGADPQRVHVTGSVKYDGVSSDRDNPKTHELRRLLDVRSEDLVWVAGSTQAPEEEIVLNLYRQARARHPNLRLFLVPRQKDRFEEVAALLSRSGLPFLRRSFIQQPVTDRAQIILVDTIGELGSLWGLADVAFVGGSLDGKRGGQNMIEPAAYGAAVVFGPHVWNFRDTAARLVDAGAAIQVSNAAELEKVIERLLSDRSERQRLGVAAQHLVRSQQGATERTIDCLEQLLASEGARGNAA